MSDKTDHAMRTPNDYLRALLLELAEKHDLGDNAIARAHHANYEGSTLAHTTVRWFREKGHPPSQLIEEAYAAATGTTREQNWNEAIRRWRSAMRQDATQSVRQARSSARQRSA